MSFRTRILIACLIAALAPLVLLALGARNAVRNRLTSQYEVRVEAMSDVVRQDLAREAVAIDARLDGIRRTIDEDPELRAALLRLDHAALVDFAPSVMASSRLEFLLLTDSAGTVLSSGHFRSDYGRTTQTLSALLAAQEPVLMSTRRAEGSFLALVRARRLQIGDLQYVLVGGTEVDSLFVRSLARDQDSTVVVSLQYPGGMLASMQNQPHTAANRETDLLFLDDVAESAGVDRALWSVAHSELPLQQVLRSMDLWFAAAGGAALLLAIVLARVLAAHVNRPLEELAEKTTDVNLDRIDVGFSTDRDDEIGALSRLLDAMVDRLRISAQQLRITERRATVGDLARQVNHDLKNGLLPIRNVIRHLSEVARESPAELETVYAEREATLQGGISYLETLATNYARLSRPTDRQSCDVNGIIRAVMRDAPASERTQVQLELSSESPRVRADPIALRRILENLAINAIESLPNGAGTVRVSTSVHGATGRRQVTIAIADTGSGIAPAALERVFDDFYSTKERGSGLGLSIVRRLVADMDGRIQVQSTPGRGTRFEVELPEAA